MVAGGSAPACITTRSQLVTLLETVEEKYAEAQEAWTDAEAMKVDKAKHDEAVVVAETVEDMAVQLMKNYITAKRRLKFLYNLTGYAVPIDNVLHSMWNGVDVIMNQELISTTDQKYMYKAYIETVLNNSASTKTYQLETGFYGDQEDKDSDFRQTFNPGMTQRYMKFKDDKKVKPKGFLHLDIMGIQGSIVSGVEINLLPNQDNICVQAFGSDVFGKLVVDNVVLYVCKQHMSKEVVVAHADVMKDTEDRN